MILLFNVGLFPDPLNQKYIRSTLPEDKVDIFKASLKNIAPLYDWGQVIIKFYLDSSYKHREQELIDFINDTFKDRNLIISKTRNEYQKDWIDTYNQLTDETIFYSCNHDHIFIGCPAYFKQCIETFEKEAGDYATLYLSHFGEIATSTTVNEEKLIGKVGPFLKYRMGTYDSFLIMTKKLFKNWWLDEILPNIPFPRSDYHPYSLNQFKKIEPEQFFFAPLREIFRHYDGYSTIHNNYAYFEDYPPMTLAEETIPPPIEALRKYCNPKWYWAYEAENNTI